MESICDIGYLQWYTWRKKKTHSHYKTRSSGSKHMAHIHTDRAQREPDGNVQDHGEYEDEHAGRHGVLRPLLGVAKVTSAVCTIRHY